MYITAKLSFEGGCLISSYGRLKIGGTWNLLLTSRRHMHSLTCGSTPPSHTDRKTFKVKKKWRGATQFLFYSIGC